MNWKDKKVLVTGAGGFIGSHLSELLSLKGASVRAFVRYNSTSHAGWLDKSVLRDKIEIFRGNIRDRDSVENAIEGCDVVFHLAALIGIPYSYVAPEDYVDVNIKGTLNVCQAARKHCIERLIHTSTSEVYGTARYVPIDEKHPLQPQSPYSATKMSADAIALSYFNTYDLPVTVARPFNTYGPRQSARAIIPTIIIQIASGQKQIKVGDMKPTRDFNYVEDTCHGFIALAEKQSSIGQSINIGSNYEISMEDTLKIIKNLMGSNIKVLTDGDRIRPEKSEVFRLWCDNSLMQQMTGFVPQISLEDGLQKTIEWLIQPENLSLYRADTYYV